MLTASSSTSFSDYLEELDAVEMVSSAYTQFLENPSHNSTRHMHITIGPGSPKENSWRDNLKVDKVSVTVRDVNRAEALQLTNHCEHFEAILDQQERKRASMDAYEKVKNYVRENYAQNPFPLPSRRDEDPSGGTAGHAAQRTVTSVSHTSELSEISVLTACDLPFTSRLSASVHSLFSSRGSSVRRGKVDKIDKIQTVKSAHSTTVSTARSTPFTTTASSSASSTHSICTCTGPRSFGKCPHCGAVNSY